MPFVRSLTHHDPAPHVCRWQVPEWMLSLKKERPKDRRKLEVSAPKRRHISTVSGYDKQRSFKRKQARVASQRRRQQEQEREGGKGDE